MMHLSKIQMTIVQLWGTTFCSSKTSNQSPESRAAASKLTQHFLENPDITDKPTPLPDTTFAHSIDRRIGIAYLHTMKDAEELTRDMPNTAAADR